MPDREKVIHDLERCTCNEPNACRDCSHNVKLGVGCTEYLLKDALALLKEQKAVKPVRDTIARRFWVCGNCGEYVGFEDDDPFDLKEFDNYCRRCGKPVLWEGR